MRIVCILLVLLGAGIMVYSIARYYSFLARLKKQIKAYRLFSNLIYAACFIMMLFFLIGYVFVAVVYIVNKETAAQDLLTALIFFFGAVFVIAMVTMVHRMFADITDKADLKKQLRQQELMSAIAQSFTTTEDSKKLICQALKMSGEFMNVNHAFLSKYRREQNVLECLYEWYDETGRPFVGAKSNWPISPDMDFFSDFVNKGHIAVSDYRMLTHPNFEVMKDHHLGAFLNIPIDVSGKFWGILGFVIYENTNVWDESDIHLGKMIAGIFSGVIARHMADRELVRAKEAAEQASRTKSDFLSRMSHEMRTPMNAIIGMTTIGKKSQDSDQKNYCLEKIQSASAHLLGVINDILDMSKIEADKLELSYVDFSIEKMLEKITGIFGYQMEEKKQHFVLSAAGDVPRTINCDEQRISQILANLISNAVKFTPDGGTISLFVRKLAEENGICTLQFEVKDTGIGITQEHQKKLFNSFEQADGSISRKYGGTGLGLAISKRLVEMMDGTIRVESETGLGTSFIFSICAGVVQQDELHETSVNNDAIAPEEYAEGCFRNRKILVVEDIAINREIVAALLEFTGVAIDFAEDGRMAHEIFARNPQAYDMIFMDIHMPDIDGYEATRMIRGIDNPGAKTIPIIAMTADVFREDIEKCLAAGMNDHVGKPLEIDTMLAKLAMYSGIAQA